MALLTYDQAAAMLGMPRSTLYALVHQRRIPHIRIGPRFVRFDSEELERWVNERRVAATDPEPRHGTP